MERGCFAVILANDKYTVARTVLSIALITSSTEHVHSVDL